MKDTIAEIFHVIKSEHVEFVDFRFSDLNGKPHHITMLVKKLEEKTFEEGFSFDGSSVAGWCEIHKSDMFFVPDAGTWFIDPFMEHSTIVFICDVVDPETGDAYNRCPRGVAGRAEDYLTSTKIADTAYFGPELEFFLFNSVSFSNDADYSHFSIESESAGWNNAEGSSGHAPALGGGYFGLAPKDKFQDVRSTMLQAMEAVGISPSLHHAEVATAGQSECGFDAGDATTAGDHAILYKYVVHQVAEANGLTATFMPKPINGDNGSGMHVHQSLWKNDIPLFAGDAYDGLSQDALYYIGGLIKHAKALNAFTNPLTNSYKRLVPGYEAPVIMAYASRNRSAAIRIPSATAPKAKRVEARFPDCGANLYLANAAMLMAGLDGIKNKIDPGKPMENNLYALSEAKEAKLPHVARSLEEALQALKDDHAFLLEGNVFDKDLINAYISVKQKDIDTLAQTVSPIEYQMYYSV